MISKTARLNILNLFICFFFTTLLSAQAPQNISLNGEWFMIPAALSTPLKVSDSEQSISEEGYATQLPNTVLRVLWKNRAIKDPFLLQNTPNLQWLETKDWIFERNFDVDSKTLTAEKVELILKGVDTYAGVFLNDILVFKTDNAFRTWSAEVKYILQPKNNRLRIHFISPFNKNIDFGDSRQIDINNAFPLTKLNDTIFEETLANRLVSMGLQSAELKVWSKLKLEEVFIKQIALSETRADLEAQTVIHLTAPNKVSVKVNYEKTIAVLDTFLETGEHHLNLPFVILNPQLWWTKNLGNPFLYDIQTVVNSDSGQSDAFKSRIGLRRIALIKKQNGHAETFSLQINGVPIPDEKESYSKVKMFNEYIRRGNWLTLVEKVAASNNPMIYLSGILGTFPHDDFYRLCDEQGIIVWQDFALSNTIFMSNNMAKEHLEMEASDQVRRLRTYACVAVWCGNMEPFQRFKNRYQPVNRMNVVDNEPLYKALFQDNLSKIVSNNTNQTVFGTFSKQLLTNFADNSNMTASTSRYSREDVKTPQAVSKPENNNVTAIATTTSKSEKTNAPAVATTTSKGEKTNVPVVVATTSKVEKANTPAVATITSKGEKTNVPAVATTTSKVEKANVPIVASINSEQKGFEEVFLALKIERDTFKLTVKNDRTTRATGDFLVDVYDLKGRLLFNDARMMRVEANSSVQFYRYDLKTMLQGQRLSDIVIVTTWKDAYNNMREMKNTFHVDPTTGDVTNDVKRIELNK